MKNLLEAAEDYTKQAGLAGPGRVEVLHVRSGLLLGLAVPRRWRKRRAGAQRCSSQPHASRRRRNSRRWPCGAHRGRRQNGNASHFAAKNERTRRCGPAMMDARS